MVDVEVKFESNGGSDVEPLIIKTYSYAEVVFEPIRDGYEFVGWYTDKALSNLFDFENTEITGPMTLYAKWKADEVFEDDDSLIDDDSTIDDDLEEIGNGERPVIDDADPIKQVSNKVTEENKSVNPLVIVAIICGGVLVAAGLVVVLILLLRKKRNKTIVGG
jgi:uncharacterized repeat protein (TIGR02543 family)